MVTSLADIARAANVSVKTASGALNDSDARMSAETRRRIKAVAGELGYITNLAARGTRQGWLPLIAIISDGVITSPFATDIMRSLDSSIRRAEMAIFAIPTGRGSSLKNAIEDVRRFRPHAIGFAAMYHKRVELVEELAAAIGVMINCQTCSGRVTSLVPDEAQAARDLIAYLLSRGRRRIAFINLPGLLADDLRRAAIEKTLAAAGLPLRPDWVRPAVKQSAYNDRAPSLVAQHLAELMAGRPAPDAIVCGNDRVAMEAYFGLHRVGAAIPADVAVVSFDNQIDLATRLDPPLTTMALPHRMMGRLAAKILLSDVRPSGELIKLPFELIERASV